MFTGRQLKIIELIFNNTQGIHGSKIAELLSVSSRTIRHEIGEINDRWQNECCIKSSKKSGYYFQAENIQFVRDFLFKYRNLENEDTDSEKRRYAILGLLLFDEDMELDEIGERLYVSSQTVYKDILKLQQQLKKKYGIELLNISGSYVRIIEDEHKIRELMFKIIKDEVLIKESAGTHYLKDLLPDAYDQSEYEYLLEQIKHYFNEQGVMLTDGNLIMAASAIYIAIVRNQYDYRAAEVENSGIDSNVKRLIDVLIQAQWSLYPQDMYSLNQFLHTFKLNDEKDESDISNFSIHVLDEFCQEVLDKYNFDLRTSEALYLNMLAHFEYMLRRLENEFQLLNPILDDVKKKYPYAYEISMLIVHIVYKYKNTYVQDDEISYIAIYLEHFLENVNQKLNVILISSARLSVSHILLNWLKNNFSNQLNVQTVLPIHSLASYVNENAVDLILSTNDMALHPIIPTYKINSLPSSQDQLLLNDMIHTIRISQRFREVVKKHFSPEMIKIYEDKTTFESIITDMAQKLETYNKINDAEEFAKDVLQREINYPTFVNDLFMIPHPLMTFANKTAVSVAILKKPLLKDGRSVQLIFTLAIERKQNDDVRVLFQIFKQIAANKQSMKMLIEATDNDKFLSALINLSGSIQ